jgi:hypothetical protein
MNKIKNAQIYIKNCTKFLTVFAGKKKNSIRPNIGI